MTEHTPTPWAYRPQKYDDWGYIRGPKEPDGFAPLAAIARGEASETHDAHRAAGTDPYGPNALLIVKAVNNHDALVKALSESRSALVAFKDAVEASQKMNGREYIGLGIQINDAIGRAYDTLAFVGALPGSAPSSQSADSAGAKTGGSK